MQSIVYNIYSVSNPQLVSLCDVHAILRLSRPTPCTGDRGCMDAAVRSCVFGADGSSLLPTSEPSGGSGSGSGAPREHPPLRQAMVLVFCVVGLLGSYLSWGVLQEKIMTKVRNSGSARLQVSWWHICLRTASPSQNRVMLVTRYIMALNSPHQISHVHQF